MNTRPPLARFEPELLALLRIVAGLQFLEHGLVKLVGFPPGAPPGMVPLESFLGIAGVIETVTGMLLVLGLFSRIAGFIASGEMAIAYWTAHAPHSPFPAVNGGDAAILFCFLFLYIAARGPGRFAIDTRRGDASALRATV